jgi:hypothetical protein
MNPEIMLATAAGAERIVAVGPLASQEEADHASRVLRALHAVKKDGDAARKAEKAPHLKAGRDVDARYQPAIKELDRVIKLIKAAIADRALALEEARTRALVAPPAEANALLATLPQTELSGVSERWSWEVESAVLSEVPDRFLQLDAKEVAAEIKQATKEARQPRIPGIRFRRKVTVVAR